MVCDVVLSYQRWSSVVVSGESKHLIVVVKVVPDGNVIFGPNCLLASYSQSTGYLGKCSKLLLSERVGNIRRQSSGKYDKKR